MSDHSPSTIEVWKPITEMEGAYEVSTLGRLRRLRPASGTRPGTILHPCPSKIGYLKVRLFVHGRGRTFDVHWLVARAFLGPAAGRHCNHIDTNKHNNCLENLEWISRTANIRHSARKLSVEKARAIRARLAGGEDAKSVAVAFGVARSTIYGVKHSTTWREDVGEKVPHVITTGFSV